MTHGAVAFLIFVFALALWLLLRPSEQPLRVETVPASWCEPIDYRAPGYRHPWEPITEHEKDPRNYA